MRTFFTIFQGHAFGAPGRAVPGPNRIRGAGVTEGIASWSEGGVATAKRAAEKLAYSGTAACRALRAGAHRARRCRRSAASAPAGRRFPLQRAHGDRASKPAGPSSSRRAFFRRAKITVKSARYARVLRMALRATPDCDLPRQDLAPIRRTDQTRLDPFSGSSFYRTRGQHPSTTAPPLGHRCSGHE